MQQIAKFGDFKDIHDALGINTSDLGCVMLDFKTLVINPIPDSWLYTSDNPEHFWIKGWVGDYAHVTLLYGLLKPASEWENYVLKLLGDWEPVACESTKIIRFESPYHDEKYVCLAAELHVSDEILDAYRRLSFLPHIDTFTPYRPHVSLAYVKEEYADDAEEVLIEMGSDIIFIPTTLNLGSEKS